MDTYFTYFPYDISSVIAAYDEQELISKDDRTMGINKAQDSNANNNAKDAKVESGGTTKPSSAGWSRLKNTTKATSGAGGGDSTKDSNPLIEPPSGDEKKSETAPSKPKSAGWNRLKGATTKPTDAKPEETRCSMSKELLTVNANGSVKPILTRTDSLVVPGQTQRPSISFSEGRDSLHSQSEKSLGSRRGSRFSGESRFSAIDLSKITAVQNIPEEEEEEDQSKGMGKMYCAYHKVDVLDFPKLSHAGLPKLVGPKY